MKELGSSAGVAWTSLALAALVSLPVAVVGAKAADVARVAVAASLILGLAARALSSAGSRVGRTMSGLIAMGALASGAGLGYDALCGHSGVLTVSAGDGSRVFQETDVHGRSLGMRPFGFDIARIDPEADGVRLEAADGVARLVSATRSASLHGYRFGAPVVRLTGEVERLRIRASGLGHDEPVELTPPAPVRVGDTEITLDRYFPDFALDANQKPFTRSLEPRHPAVLLQVRQGQRAWRVFALAGMPGLHRPEGLEATFALEKVEPERYIELSVSREPAAPVVWTGLLLVALGLLLQP